MKFQGFKEHIGGNTLEIKKLKSIVRYVLGGIKKLLSIGQVNESFSYEADRLEPTLFPSTCEFVCKFLVKNGVEVKNHKYNRRCGGEGCAYFYGDKVLKCTFGKDEWHIATLLKGEYDLVPVIDTAQESQTKVYLILSWFLDNDSVYKKLTEIDKAGMIIYDWFNESKLNKLKELLDLENFKHTLQGLDISEEIREITLKFFELVLKIYRKTGFMLSTDIQPINVGYTKKGNLQLFDLGRSFKPN